MITTPKIIFDTDIGSDCDDAGTLALLRRLSSYEIGSYIRTMVDYPQRAAKDDPVARAYDVHNHGAGRCSWDLTAMLDAVRPGRYWNYHGYGRVSVDEALVTHWTRDETRKHTYLLPKTDYEGIGRIMDDIIDGK